MILKWDLYSHETLYHYVSFKLSPKSKIGEAVKKEAKQILDILQVKGPTGETELQAWTLLDFDSLQNALNELSDEGLVMIDPTSWVSSGGIVKLTTKGLQYLNFHP